MVLDMRKATNFCDYFVICSGNSERQVESITDVVQEGILKENIKTIKPNGAKNGLWSLLDYGDVVIHIFSKEVRDFYNLERLWIDAKKLRIPKD